MRKSTVSTSTGGGTTDLETVLTRSSDTHTPSSSSVNPKTEDDEREKLRESLTQGLGGLGSLGDSLTLRDSLTINQSPTSNSKLTARLSRASKGSRGTTGRGSKPFREIERDRDRIKHNRQKKHSTGSGHHFSQRGPRASSSTNVELMNEIRQPRTRHRLMSDGRTEFGSFRSTDFNIRSRSMRIDSELTSFSKTSKNSLPSKSRQNRVRDDSRDTPTGPSIKEQSTLGHLSQQKVPRAQRPKLSGKKPGDFFIGEMIGEGAYARVHICREKESRTLFALKLMEKRFIMAQKKAYLVKAEQRVLRVTNCQHIVKLVWSFQDTRHLFLVLELCTLGTTAKLVRH